MSKKIKCVISCPLDTYSGYGKRSYDFIRQLIKVKSDWDIKILSQRWGNCRMGFLKDHGEQDLINRIIPQLTEQPDIWIQITVPNEFQATGKYNIGITAAMETTLCDPSWVQGCNRMNLILVSSTHSKQSLLNSVYRNDNTRETLEIKVPVEVLFEGVDLDTFHYQSDEKDFLTKQEVSNEWNFLCIGHWMQGDYGQDRKNIGYTVKTFLETFKNMENAPGLILKTCRASSSIVDKQEILNRLYSIRENVLSQNPGAVLPNIYLLYGDLSDKEMNRLYNDTKVKAMISFTKGEGFGRPLIEFATIGKPIVCSGWSGQLDFLNKDSTMLVGGHLEKVHPSAVVPNMILAEASWFTPNDKQATQALIEVYNHYGKWSKFARQYAKIIASKFSLEGMGKKIGEFFTEQKYLPEFPEKVELKLPEE